MADREAQRKIYAYNEMSNKVQQADRSSIPPRSANEATGEVESLWGRDIGRMGDLIRTSNTGNDTVKKRPTELKEIMERAEDTKRRKRKKVGGRKESLDFLSGERDIVSIKNLGDYRPSHAKSRASYEILLNTIRQENYLGNQPTSILTDAANEIISTLKNDHLRDPDRHDYISKLLTGKSPTHNGVSHENYAKFVSMVKGLDDYEEILVQKDNEEENETIDNDMGVAVVFDEEDTEERGPNADEYSDIQDDEVVEISSTSEEGEESVLEYSDKEQDSKNNHEEVEEKYVQGIDEKWRNKSYTRELSVHEIDAHWLQRQLSQYYEEDAGECAKIADKVLDIIDPTKTTDKRQCENYLLVLLDSDLFDLIKLILINRIKLWGCVSLKRAKCEQEREAVISSLKHERTGVGAKVYEEIYSKGDTNDWAQERMKNITDTFHDGLPVVLKDTSVSCAIDSIHMKSEQSKEENIDKKKVHNESRTKQDQLMELNLTSLAFREGSHIMSNKSCTLPKTSWRVMKKGYEEIHVPAVQSASIGNHILVKIKELPTWAQLAFPDTNSLNIIQSRMYQVSLNSEENILLCAPTGAGKTNVAMLTMLNIVGKYRNSSSVSKSIKPTYQTAIDIDVEDTEFDSHSFKIVYVAPMKALVQEVVRNFSTRLAPYNISVRELSGDSSLTRKQILETHVIVTTPEKWDIVTRQGEERAYTQLVKLVIFDEIHLLHDDRGPVLESLVSRMMRLSENSFEPVRLVGLSATLPNYHDVATFLHVKPDKGLFFFDHSYRPVPLQMQYLGFTERNSFKRFQLMNEICYDKALLQRRNGNQILIFVHSRKETGKTARALRDLAVQRDELPNFVKEGGATQQILKEEVGVVKNSDLQQILQYGFGIHHAGMCRTDRELTEDLFADGHIAVLCCTATLAWGVNLPAHAVIIKGTQIYNPKKGCWTELNPLDVLQMLGRAGRPQYDTNGEGIIMTAHSELQYYLSLTNLQLPVESQLISSLPDVLNAEIVLGNIDTIDDAVEWLKYTFLYVRMLKIPELYGIHNAEETLKADPSLKGRRMDLAHTAAIILEKSDLIRYNKKSGNIQSLIMGRLASHYYISHGSMSLFGRYIRPNLTDIEILRLFSQSGEFSHITVREEEKLELTKLAAKIPIPVKESTSDPLAKINILLQAYVSRLKLEGFALVSDMIFIQQSAGRIMRALFELSLRRNWSSLAKLTLTFSNIVSHRMWKSQSPLRQFLSVPDIVARKLERKTDIEWVRYYDLIPGDLGELVGVPKMGRILHKLIHQFPKLELNAQLQPITRSMLRIELTLLSDFEFSVKIHGHVQLFHVIVEDVNGDNILHHEVFTLKNTKIQNEHTLILTIPILDPLPPLYFIRVLNDRWLHSESVLPVSFRNMILPPKFPPTTELLDMQLLTPSSLGEKAFMNMYNFQEFNPLQTQTFYELFKSDRNTLVCAPTGSGKTVCAEFAILRMLVTNDKGKCVYVSPKVEVVDYVYTNWQSRFGYLFPKDQIVYLSGDSSSDLHLLTKGKIIISTVQHWDLHSRRWKQRKVIQQISLFIMDDLHFLGADGGPTMEIVMSRMRYMSLQKQKINPGEKLIPLRLVGLSSSLANAREIGEWMGVPTKCLFNFSPKVRPLPLEIFFQSFDQNLVSNRYEAMVKPVYNAISKHADGKPTIVFVPSSAIAELTVISVLNCRRNQDVETFHCNNVNLNSSKIREQLSHLSISEYINQQTVHDGIGYVHKGISNNDYELILQLYQNGVIGVLLCPFEMCWSIRAFSHLVIIMGTEIFDGKEQSYVDCSITDMLQMMGKGGRQGIDRRGKCVILCHAPKKERLKKLLYDPLPIESHLDHYLHDHFNSEIVTKSIVNMQDAVDYITWTFLYRRLTKNPNYYNLHGTSNQDISEHISEMVETVLGDLVESKCCQLSHENSVSPLNLGLIAAYYYVEYSTIELMASSVTESTRIRGILEVASAASEFSILPLRQGEDHTLKTLAKNIKYQIPDNAQYNDSSTKALVLLQCHFHRIPISNDLQSDQKFILRTSITILSAIVDVISSQGWLRPALASMKLSQMVVQGLWHSDNVLKQIPHFNDDILQRCQAYRPEDTVDSVLDILTIDDDVRNDLLRLPNEKMIDVAEFCNTYPNIDVNYQVQDEDDVTAADPVQILVNLERDIEDDDITDIGRVCAPKFPKSKQEGWWVVIGNIKTNEILSLKRTTIKMKQTVTLEFIAPEEAGDYNLMLFLISDSYIGCDQEYSMSLNVGIAESDGENESGSESSNDIDGEDGKKE